MTCIVGIEHNGDVFIGGDSASVNDNLDLQIRADEKVFTKGGMVFGFCGSFRVGQILRYSFNAPGQAIGEEDYAYLCGKWIDSLIECLKGKGCIYDKEREISHEAHFLIGLNGKLYAVYGNFQVARRIQPYNACGCASDLALGTIAAISDMVIAFEPEELLLKGLEIAERFSAGVSGPFIVKHINAEE